MQTVCKPHNLFIIVMHRNPQSTVWFIRQIKQSTNLMCHQDAIKSENTVKNCCDYKHTGINQRENCPICSHSHSWYYLWAW